MSTAMGTKLIMETVTAMAMVTATGETIAMAIVVTTIIQLFNWLIITLHLMITFYAIKIPITK